MDQFVLIPKGTTVFSTAPGWPDVGKSAARSYLVKVRSATSFIESTGQHEHELVEVCWTGSGGYWKWADLYSPTFLSALEVLAKKVGKS